MPPLLLRKAPDKARQWLFASLGFQLLHSDHFFTQLSLHLCCRSELGRESGTVGQKGFYSGSKDTTARGSLSW